MNINMNINIKFKVKLNIRVSNVKPYGEEKTNTTNAEVEQFFK